MTVSAQARTLPPTVALFTVETARAAAIKSQESRRRRLNALRSAVDAFREPSTDAYLHQRLARVRAQLSALDSHLDSELTKATPDSKRVKELAQAAEDLAEQERKLAGRPLPGSRRPGAHEPPPPRPGLPTPR